MQKRSVIWACEKSVLIGVVAKAKTFTEILGFFGLRNIGGNFRTLKKRLAADNVSFDHIPQGPYASRGRVNYKSAVLPDSAVFIENSMVCRAAVKRRVIQRQLIPYQCAVCNCDPIWNSQELVLILDHINGNNRDHRITNLRFVCPNCNSQLETFGGRNIKYNRRACQCGRHIPNSNKSGKCFSCLQSSRVSTRPTGKELYDLVWSKPITALAREYGISDKAIHKWCAKDKIIKPPAGYWNNRLPTHH